MSAETQRPWSAARTSPNRPTALMSRRQPPSIPFLRREDMRPNQSPSQSGPTDNPPRLHPARKGSRLHLGSTGTHHRRRGGRVSWFGGSSQGEGGVRKVMNVLTNHGLTRGRKRTIFVHMGLKNRLIGKKNTNRAALSLKHG